MTSYLSSGMIGWVAIAAGIVGLLALVAILLFFIAGQPFGTANDVLIGVAAVLSGVLAWMLYSTHHAQAPISSQVALGAAWAGALVAVAGSALVVSGATGWFLAGLYMSAGNALIGAWLLALNLSFWRSGPWPHSLAAFGLITGAIMLLGLVAVPGIFKGLDSRASAPWIINYVGQAGGLGWLMLYPIWCLLLGRTLLGA